MSPLKNFDQTFTVTIIFESNNFNESEPEIELVCCWGRCCWGHCCCCCCCWTFEWETAFFLSWARPYQFHHPVETVSPSWKVWAVVNFINFMATVLKKLDHFTNAKGFFSFVKRSNIVEHILAKLKPCAMELEHVTGWCWMVNWGLSVERKFAVADSRKNRNPIICGNRFCVFLKTVKNADFFIL